MSVVIPLRPRAARLLSPPAIGPRLRPGAEVYVAGNDAEGWIVIDMSPSGGSAGTHGTFARRDEAMAEGRRVAHRIGATFLDDDEGAA